MDTRGEWDWLASIYFPVMVAVTVLVCAGLLLPVVRHRRRQEAPSQHSEAPRLEAAVAIVLLAIAAGLLVFTEASETRFGESQAVATAHAGPGASEPLRIDVTGARWRWRFVYPQHDIALVGGEPRDLVQLVVPRGRPVRFNITSIDVVHSLFFVEARFKRDAIPGYINRATLRFDREGRSFGHCAEFCGTYHPDMNIELVVLDPAAFDRWAARGGGRV